jgi:Spy/CpxP family protein refolding chaperone
MKLKGEMLICLLVTIGLSLTTAVYAGSTCKSLVKHELRPGNRDARIVEINQQLNLSPAQDRQLQEQRNKHEKERDELNEHIMVNKEELKKELQKPELQMEKINHLHSELKVLLGQREDQRLKHILEVRKILTPEQLKKFLELIERYHHDSKGKEQNRE